MTSGEDRFQDGPQSAEPSAPAAPSRKPLSRFLPLAVIAAGLAAFFALGGPQYLTIETFVEQRNNLKGFVEGNFAFTALVFITLYAIAVAFSVPGAAVLTLTSGFMFGFFFGGLFAVIGATVGALGIFLVAKTALGDALREKAGPWVSKLEAGFRENAISYMVILRLVPVFPFWLVNIVPAFFGVGILPYALTTFIGIIPGTFVYASIGNAIGQVIDSVGPDEDINAVIGERAGEIFAQPAVWGPIVGLIGLSLIPVLYKKVKGLRPEADLAT